MLNELASGALALGVELDLAKVGQFGLLLEQLQRVNARLNLTSLRDPGAIVHRHFLESIALGARLREQGLLEPGITVIDLGSGAGFPGLPLKLVWPDVNVDLLEATGKKARFLESAVNSLHLSGTRVLAGRAETLGHDQGLREQYALVVARAVARLPALVELALPFLRQGGTLAAMKGSHAFEELESAKTAMENCGGAFVGELELGGGRLCALVIEKVMQTPDRYPRRPGQPSAHPLSRRE